MEAGCALERKTWWGRQHDLPDSAASASPAPLKVPTACWGGVRQEGLLRASVRLTSGLSSELQNESEATTTFLFLFSHFLDPTANQWINAVK